MSVELMLGVTLWEYAEVLVIAGFAGGGCAAVLYAVHSVLRKDE